VDPAEGAAVVELSGTLRCLSAQLAGSIKHLTTSEHQHQSIVALGIASDHLFGWLQRGKLHLGELVKNLVYCLWGLPRKIFIREGPKGS
jgi:hypothetical protein